MSCIAVRAVIVAVLCVIISGGGKVNGQVDVGSQIPCNGVEFPPENVKWCYRTAVDDQLTPTNCDAMAIAITNQTVEYKPSDPNASYYAAKLWSPGKLRIRDYQNNRLCLYNAACPAGFFLEYEWVQGNFNLEDEDEENGCLDYVKIENFDQEDFEFCSFQPGHSARRSVPLRVEFRSNGRQRRSGFQIEVECVDPALQDTPGCRESPDPMGRKKRRVPQGLTSDPLPTVPQTGDTVSVPRAAFILYENNILKIQVNGQILRTFSSIKALYFWTGYNGTRVFRGSAPCGVVFGGGVLQIIDNNAYYTTVQIPPSFEPTEGEQRIISILLNATTPFFVDQDIIDIDPVTTDRPPIPRPTEPTPYTRPPPTSFPGPGPPGLPGVPGPAPRPPGTGIDPRIDEEALWLAEEFQNACNVFLRGAAITYLNILEELDIRP